MLKKDFMFNSQGNLSQDIKNLERAPKDESLQTSNASLMLDGYDHIFSGFDPRGMHERSISDDFIRETRKVVIGRSTEELEMNFLVPRAGRVPTAETVIKKRLHAYFQTQFQELNEEHRKKVAHGAVFVAVGLILMFTAAWLIFYFHEKLFGIEFLIVLLEPGGWFFFWEGLDDMIFESNTKKKERRFYKRMSRAKISFGGY